MRAAVKAGLAAAAIALAFGAAEATSERGGETAPKLRAGKAAYARWCAACHAPDPRLAGTLALQTKYEGAVPPALEDRTDLSPEAIAYFVRNGIAWMPPFRPTEIGDEELAGIGAYLTAPIGQRGPHAPLLAEEMMMKREDRR